MEKEFVVKILKIEQVTHDVKRIAVEKPAGFQFVPGQATDVSVYKERFRDKKNPFTFTCLPTEKYLEFTIKIYEERKGVTYEIDKLKKGDSLIIREPFGAIHFKGEGVFIAGGAGVTPFIAILRQLRRNGNLEGNTLIFSNKTEKDIILRDEFDLMAKEGLKVIYTLTREKKDGLEFGRIDEKFLISHVDKWKQYFYVCGPLRMVGEIQHLLKKLGANVEFIVVET